MTITIANMVDHVERFCRSQEINIFYWCRRSNDSYSLAPCDEIYIAPIKSVVTYAVALHEIGHLRGRHQKSRHCIVRERWAWEWAKRNALVWTPRMERNAAASLQWYADGGAAVVDRNWQPPSVF
jgi:hypothetical protein